MPYESIKILEKQKADILINQISRPGLHQYELDLTNRMLGSIHRSLKNYTEAIASYQSIQIPEFKSELQSSIKNLQKLEALGNWHMVSVVLEQMQNQLDLAKELLKIVVKQQKFLVQEQFDEFLILSKKKICY